MFQRIVNGANIRQVGLNADWCVSAWVVGTVNGQPVYLIDTEDGSYETVIRFHVADGVYVDEAGHPMPERYAHLADNMNDVIVTIAVYDSLIDLLAAVRQA